jgi:hypothetical protein
MRTTQHGSTLVISNVEDLMRAGPLSSVTELVLETPAQPRGDLLAALGRMNVEYPSLRKSVVMSGPPSLPIAVFLASCGARMSWPGRAGDNQEE